MNQIFLDWLQTTPKLDASMQIMTYHDQLFVVQQFSNHFHRNGHTLPHLGVAHHSLEPQMDAISEIFLQNCNSAA